MTQINLSKLSTDKLILFEKKLDFAIKKIDQPSEYPKLIRLIIFRKKIKKYLEKRLKNKNDLVECIVTYGDLSFGKKALK